MSVKQEPGTRYEDDDRDLVIPLSKMMMGSVYQIFCILHMSYDLILLGILRSVCNVQIGASLEGVLNISIFDVGAYYDGSACKIEQFHNLNLYCFKQQI